MTDRVPAPVFDSLPARLLKLILLIIGATLMTAAIPMCFPITTMNQIHQWLGLGEMPSQPIVAYLARSTSLLYAMHGTLMLMIGLQLNQYLPLAKVLGWLHVAAGLALLFIDLTAPMPWFWTAAEGVPIALAGAIIFLLARHIEKLKLD